VQRSRFPLLVAAVVLALGGSGLIGWAATHQLSVPSVPLGSAAPFEGDGAAFAGATSDVAAIPPAVRMIVVERPPAPPGFRPGPLFGDGPGSVSVRFVAATPPPGSGAASARPAAALVPSLPPSTPSRLRIPAIGVDAAVGSVGLNPDGTMEVPAPGPTWDVPSWYRYSVTPGERGPAVIVGHVDSRVSGPSIFFDLARLRPGDVVEVTRADRSVARFAVTRAERFPKDAFPTAAVYSGTADPELRLITCGGSFDRAVRSYRDNTVVFARLVR
jgi:hypothetical protein